MSDRTPPQNLDAEMAVLGSLIGYQRAIPDVAEILTAADFYKPAHEKIYAAILDLHNRTEPVDALTVIAELERRGELAKIGGAPEVHRLGAFITTSASATWHAQIVRDAATRRRLIETGTRIAQMGYETDDDSDLVQIVDRAQAEANAISDRARADEDPTVRDTADELVDELKNGVEMGLPTGFRDLDQLTQGMQPGQMIIVAARPGMGKALALDTPLPTPTGWTTMGEVRTGDYLIGADGNPARVVAATDVMRDHACYEVEFSDGSVIVADADHQWLTDTRSSLRSRQAAGKPWSRQQNQRTFAAVRTTKEIAATLRCETADRRLNHSIANASPLQTPDADLLVAPYTLGAWLGDGDSNGAAITTPDREVLDEIVRDGYRVHHPVGDRTGLRHRIQLPETAPVAKRSCIACGVEFQPNAPTQNTCGRSCGMSSAARRARQCTRTAKATCPDCGKPFTGFVSCQECHEDHGTLQALLRKIGVLGNKHIPAVYLRASETQRRALLAGLLDSDGYCAKDGATQFAVTRERLARDVYELVVSLGYKPTLTSKPARLNGKDCGTAWTVTFTTADRVFRLPRKANRLRSTTSPINGRRFITDVRPVQSVPVRCVQVDNADHLYVAGRAWIPTHNSTLGLDLVRHVSIRRNLPSVFFSLEMNRKELVRRCLSAEGGIPLHHLAPRCMSDDDWQRLGLVYDRVVGAPIVLDDRHDLTVMRMRSKARRIKQTRGLSLAVVDYAQLAPSGTARKHENRQTEVTEISRNLKLMAKELEIPVVVLAQLNRGPVARSDKRPVMSDLRESGSLEQDADLVILLHREDAYVRDSPRAGEADFIVDKHRNGATSTITVAFQGHYSRFVDMAQS